MTRVTRRAAIAVVALAALGCTSTVDDPGLCVGAACDGDDPTEEPCNCETGESCDSMGRCVPDEDIPTNTVYRLDWEMKPDEFVWSSIGFQGTVDALTIESGTQYIVDFRNVETELTYDIGYQFLSYPVGTDYASGDIKPQVDASFGFHEAEFARPRLRVYDLAQVPDAATCQAEPGICVNADALMIEYEEGDTSALGLSEIAPIDRGIRLVLEYDSPPSTERDVLLFRWCAQGCPTP